MTAPEKTRARWAIWLPLSLFAGFVLLALSGLLFPADRNVESAMIGKPLPAFELPAYGGEGEAMRSSDFAGGKPRLVNVFASWCVPCAIEAPQLEALARTGVPIDGIAIRDREEDIARFLARYGNPFARIARDDVSKVQLALGSSGVPETFVIDGEGQVRYQHLGPVMERDVPVLLEQLRKAEQPL